MEQLTIIEKDGANYHLYELEGALNAYTLGEFQETLYTAVQKNNIVLDLNNLLDKLNEKVGDIKPKKETPQQIKQITENFSCENLESLLKH